jgi:hypothetical protein
MNTLNNRKEANARIGALCEQLANAQLVLQCGGTTDAGLETVAQSINAIRFDLLDVCSTLLLPPPLTPQ